MVHISGTNKTAFAMKSSDVEGNYVEQECSGGETKFVLASNSKNQHTQLEMYTTVRNMSAPELPPRLDNNFSQNLTIFGI
jgi:hypothetical protein